MIRHLSGPFTTRSNVIYIGKVQSITNFITGYGFHGRIGTPGHSCSCSFLKYWNTQYGHALGRKLDCLKCIWRCLTVSGIGMGKSWTLSVKSIKTLEQKWVNKNACPQEKVIMSSVLWVVLLALFRRVLLLWPSIAISVDSEIWTADCLERSLERFRNTSAQSRESPTDVSSISFVTTSDSACSILGAESTSSGICAPLYMSSITSFATWRWNSNENAVSLCTLCNRNTFIWTDGCTYLHYKWSG